jgi:hypothetical protein
MRNGQAVSRRWMVRIGFAMAGVSVVGVAGAGEFWSRCKLDFHRNNFWPRPFIVADRAATRAPFDVQSNIGWRLQNTLGNEFFDENNELNQAGALKIKWILTYAPSQRRTVYILASADQTVTMARVDSVQQTISDVTSVAGTAMPQVLLTDQEAPGGSGTYYDALNRAYQDSLPAPRLPARQGSGSGSSSGSSGSGSSGGSGASGT